MRNLTHRLLALLINVLLFILDHLMQDLIPFKFIWIKREKCFHQKEFCASLHSTHKIKKHFSLLLLSSSALTLSDLNLRYLVLVALEFERMILLQLPCNSLLKHVDISIYLLIIHLVPRPKSILIFFIGLNNGMKYWLKHEICHFMVL